jgi:hypothetical protein
VTRHLPFLTALAVLSFAHPVLAQDFYVGGGIGNTYLSSEFEDAPDQLQEIDENSTGWKLFGGFTPSRFIGIEGGYRNFGTATARRLDFEAETTAWDIEALGRVRIAIIDLFGKAGGMFWSRDGKIGSVTLDDSGSDFFWGLGAGVRLGPLGVRAEWESVVMDDPDGLSMVSLSATLGF